MRTLLSFILLFILISCNKESEQYFQFNVIKVEGPTSGNIHQDLELTVYWPYSNGCEVLEKFEEFKTGNIIHIKALGHSSNGVCTLDAGIKTKIYTFIPPSAGVFEFRFINRDNSIITHTITIN